MSTSYDTRNATVTRQCFGVARLTYWQNTSYTTVAILALLSLSQYRDRVATLRDVLGGLKSQNPDANRFAGFPTAAILPTVPSIYGAGASERRAQIEQLVHEAGDCTRSV